jgi:hypothetical protein
MARAPESPIKNVAAQTLTIPAGQSLSGAIDLSGVQLYFIFMPDDWTPANISIQASYDGSKFFNAINFHGGEIMIGCRPGTCISLPPDATLGAVYLRLRSGTSEDPIPQEASRVFTLVTKA